jgi:hypothetical protein
VAEIGHNGGPPLDERPETLTAKGKLQRIEAIIERDDLTAAQKCVGVGIVVKADRDGIAEAKTQELMNFASVKDRETVFRATKTLDDKEIIEKANKKGQSGRYNVMPAKVVEAIMAARDKMVADGLGNQATGRVEPDGIGDDTGRAKPDGMENGTGRVSPDQIENDAVGFKPTPVKPVGFEPTTSPQDAPAHPPAPADITSRATDESPSEIVTTEELARRLASSLRPEIDDRPDESAGELAGLNGSAELMIVDIHQWMEPPATKANARQWLAGTLRTFGQDVTGQSYHKMKTDMLTGGIVAKPMQTWIRIAQRMKSEPKAAAPPKDTVADKRERMRKSAEAAEAKYKAQQQWGKRA